MPSTGQTLYRLAELLIELHPWADMVRFGRAGGEAMAIAIRIARAATGRDMVAFCGYHGWHDWYLSANLGATTALDGHLLPGLDTKGVPRGLAGLMHPFHFNKLDEIEAIVAEHGERLAAIVMEPVRSTEPKPAFIKGIRALADRCSAALIFDEVTSGFRINSGGAHLAYGVDPDIAVFAKAIANGFPMAAIVGRASMMDAAQETFVSSTAWTERVGPVAALTTLRKHREQNVAKHLMRIGTRIQKGWPKHHRRPACHWRIKGIGKPIPIGQIGIAPTRGEDWSIYDLMLSQLAATVGFFRSLGIRPESAISPSSQLSSTRCRQRRRRLSTSLSSAPCRPTINSESRC
jgi:glutamate-1-semialdehyde 2,1-aminomutase